MCGGTGRKEVVRGSRGRSIPACAGEPGMKRIDEEAQQGLSPRVRGNRAWTMRAASSGDGLSPRVRGNQEHRARRAAGERSIPACAGEPPGRATKYSQGVYPRVCGGTKDADFRVYPRVCGGTGQQYRVNWYRTRSIPACAGEPIFVRDALGSGAGSIPACAGEPLSDLFLPLLPRGYGLIVLHQVNTIGIDYLLGRLSQHLNSLTAHCGRLPPGHYD